MGWRWRGRSGGNSTIHHPGGLKLLALSRTPRLLSCASPYRRPPPLPPHHHHYHNPSRQLQLLVVCSRQSKSHSTFVIVIIICIIVTVIIIIIVVIAIVIHFTFYDCFFINIKTNTLSALLLSALYFSVVMYSSVKWQVHFLSCHSYPYHHHFPSLSLCLQHIKYFL